MSTVRTATQQRALAKRGKLPNLPNLMQWRLANKHFLQGVDQALCSAGLSLEKYRCLHPKVTLRHEEEFCSIPLGDLPQDVQDVSAELEERLGIIDGSGIRRLAIPTLGADDDAIVFFIDQGSIGWNAMYWLFTEGVLDGWWFFDQAHRHDNDADNAYTQVGASFLKHEGTLCLNLCHAPYGTCGHLGKLSGAAEEFFVNNKSDSKLFGAFYPLLCACFWPGAPILDIGAPEHMEMVWQKARESPILRNTGTKAQLKRWFQWQVRWVENRHHIGVVLMITSYVGMILGRWPSIYHSPAGRLICRSLPDAAKMGSESCLHMFPSVF